MKSPIRPFILACSILEEELEKALLRICIMIKPGATKVAKSTPAIGGAAPRTATTNTSMYSRAVTTGAARVWVPTFQNRRTSRW
jgi:hypothetical protein